MNPLAYVVLIPGLLVGAVIVWLIYKIDFSISRRMYVWCMVIMILALHVIMADSFGHAFHAPLSSSILLWLLLSLFMWSQLYYLHRVIRRTKALKNV
jgi:hypothetical protein